MSVPFPSAPPPAGTPSEIPATNGAGDAERAAELALQYEREQRAQRCQKELIALLAREDCTLRVTLQSSNVLTGDGLTSPAHAMQVDVLALARKTR